MKRTIVILAALFLLLMPCAAFAAVKTYSIPELDMDIEIPEDMIVFPRDIDPDDPDLAVLQTDEKTLEQYYTQNNIYLNAVQIDPLAEVVVIMTEYTGSKEIFDFNSLKETQFEAIYKEALKSEQVAKSQLTYTGYSIYKHAQATFMRMTMHQPKDGEEAYGIQYYTILNGKAINVTFHSYHGEITQADENLIKNAVDCVHFTQVQAKPKAKGMDLGEGLMVGGAAAVITALVGMVRKRKKDKAQTDPYK